MDEGCRFEHMRSDTKAFIHGNILPELHISIFEVCRPYVGVKLACNSSSQEKAYCETIFGSRAEH
jgi:hypothetical protein